jgi:twitching motility protein PilT
LHLQADSIPMIRVDGRARFLDCPPLTDPQMEEIVKDLAMQKEEVLHNLEHKGAADCAYAMPDKSARFRVNMFHSRTKYAAVLRRIVTKIPNFSDLNLPPVVESLADFHRGIVVVAGTTGSGKSTSLAAIIGKINRTRSERIITIEGPDRVPARELQEPRQPRSKSGQDTRELRVRPQGRDAADPGHADDRRKSRPVLG